MIRNFKFNWFDAQIPVFNHFLSNFKNKNNLQFLEIGSFEGKSTCWMLDNILTEKDCKITCIDSWEGGSDHSDINMKEIETSFLSNISSSKEKVEILKGVSKDRLISIQNRKNFYDFIYVDGGHTMKDVLSDLVLSFDLLKQGGIMAMDDYTWGIERPLNQRPQIGIEAFIIGWSDELNVIHKDYQVWIQKK